MNKESNLKIDAMPNHVIFNSVTGLGSPLEIPQIPGLDLVSFMKLAIDPEANTQSAFDLQKSMVSAPNRSKMIQEMMSCLESSESLKQCFKDQYLPASPSLEDLLALPEGSMGRKLASHLESNQIALDFTGYDVNIFLNKDMNLYAYFGIRALRLHDVIHCLLNLDVSPIDEFAHLAFTLAQYRSPYHASIMASGYLHVSFYEPERIGYFLERINKYHQLGIKAKFVTGYRFEDQLALPIEEVRRQLDLPEQL